MVRAGQVCAGAGEAVTPSAAAINAPVSAGVNRM